MSVSPADNTPRFRLNGPLGEAAIAAIAPAVAQSLAAWLPERRWFGDKTRTITSVAIADSAIESAPAGYWLSLLIDIDFADGAQARYFVPLAVTTDSPGPSPLAWLDTADQAAAISDAFPLADFRTGLLDQLGSGHQFNTAKGTFAWQPTPSQMATIAEARRASSRVSPAEQSNTSVIYDDALILKVFRKIQPGINPEIEIGRFLTEETSFRHMPALIGTLTYSLASGERLSLAVAQSFVPNQGDGWSFTLREIESALGTAVSQTGGEAANTLLARYSDTAEQLGRRTGQLHTALAHSAADTAFQPEPVTEADIAAWRQTTRQSLHETAAFAAGMTDLDAGARQLLARFQQAIPRLDAWADSYQALAGTTKIRVHGDYHLGQTLRTVDDDFVILDFEGEPARSLAERRAKTSALKDVAGMLRSFTYAHGAAARSLPPGQTPAEVADWLADWERQARDAFIGGYRAETTAHDVDFLPASRADFDTALAAWELDKALYEIRYEFNNRPDWLPIALTGLV